MSARSDAISSLPKAKRRIDSFMVAAGVFFVVAAAAAAYPAIKAGPATGPGLLLLIGLGGVALLSVLMFATGEQERARREGEEEQALVDALIEPACIARPDGRVAASNAAWGAISSTLRLPKGAGGRASLYTALSAARRLGSSQVQLRVSGEARGALVSRLGDTRLLVRFAAPPGADGPLLTGPAPAAAPVAPPPPPEALDAFAAAAPFGAVLLEGEEPFAAHILEFNAALEGMTEGMAAPGVPFGALLAAQGLEEARARLREKKGGPVEVKLADSKAKTAQLYVTGSGGRFVAYLLDVSEQKQMELQLAQSQKMQAIGQLAAGVAHDFNNLLNGIVLNVDELLGRHPVGDPSYEGLTRIKQISTRAADLVHKLLSFSRRKTVQREILDLGSLFSVMEGFLSRLLREDVKLVSEYGRDLPFVRADKSQIDTAVMNLVVNARDAICGGPMPPSGGVVRIRVGRVAQGEAISLGFPEAPAEGCALIEVADNGPGIPADAMTKIFEPFFTTKPQGEGTGFGLATVYGIVKQADGWIHVENGDGADGMGRGARFRIFLPIHAPTDDELTVIREPLKLKPVARDLSGSGRILFVEDEDAVRVVAARLLRARGYEVIEARDGEEALEIAEENAGKIDLMISDVAMPGMDGPTMLQKARPFLEGAKVIFISGYAEADFSNLLEHAEGVTFLPKPVEIKVLAEHVKQQLQSVA